MIIVKIIRGPASGRSIVAPSRRPDEMFRSFLESDSEWEIDYGDATLGEKSAWLSSDLMSRCFRALSIRKLPVTFVGKTYYDFDEFRDSTRRWFTDVSKETSGDFKKSQNSLYVLASLLSLERDDETGVQIELSGRDSYEAVLARQYSIFLECVKKHVDFREKGLDVGFFGKFFREELSKSISDERDAEVEILMNYADQFNWRINLLSLEEFLSLAIRQGKDRKLVWRLRELIRTAKS